MTTALAGDRLPTRLQAHEPPEARGVARDAVRMLVSEGDELVHARVRDLPGHLRPGDLLVVNTSATLPAALPAEREDGSHVDVHLSTPDAGGDPARWVVELRRDGERFRGGRPGEVLVLPGGGLATLLAPFLAGARLWVAELDTGEPLLRYLDRHGVPIRYPYVTREWPIEDYQTVFALHPGSAEMPSAGRPFTAALVADLVRHGIGVAPVLLHAGVSSQDAGEPPYPERFAVPAATARLAGAARAGGGRVVAVGTTVVRALESAVVAGGEIAAAAGWTRLVVTPERGVRAVDGLLTGWHDPEASHLLMLEAIGGAERVRDAYAEAVAEGYRWHEFGDTHLILP